jgi:signal peptidase I
MTVIRSRPPFTLTRLSRRFPLFIAVSVVVLLSSQFIGVVRILGNSMNPTLQNGQFLVSFKHITTYQIGDVVVVHPPLELQTRASRFVKRLIALPNDTISIQNDNVVLNGQVLNEPYVLETVTRAENFPEVLVSKGEVVAFEGFALAELPEYLQATLKMLEPLPKDVLEQSYSENVSYVGTIKLPEDFYFVLGDNRAFGASEDSRLFGAISKRDLLGTVKLF